LVVLGLAEVRGGGELGAVCSRTALWLRFGESD